MTKKVKEQKKSMGQRIRNWFTDLTWAKPRQWIIALIPAVLVVAADQISKILIMANLKIPGASVWIIEPVLKFIYSQNFYGLFSITYGPRFIYIILPSLAVILVLIFLLRPQRTFVAVLLGLVLGGGIGNLIDRIRLGYVVDWVSMGLKNWRWATYNIADGSIVVAVIILLIIEFFFSKPKKEEEVDEE
ncbi:signal peptidase II [candidate division WOR-3 bacterium]|nr:signal peptidase II [candidate division WOR-3 bacterium]